MSPAQFLGAMKRGVLSPAYLFLGSEAYDRRRCRQALLDVHLTPEERIEGLTHYDLSQTAVAEVIDDARALSLFASEHMRLTERFRRLDSDTLLYQFTVTDPDTFTKPWTVEIPVTKSRGPLYEYACHEGNYAMMGGLAGSRTADSKQVSR